MSFARAARRSAMAVEYLDLRNKPCPGPLVRTIRKVTYMEAGSKLIVLTNSEECVRVIRELVSALDVKSVEVVNEGTHWSIRVEK